MGIFANKHLLDVPFMVCIHVVPTCMYPLFYCVVTSIIRYSSRLQIQSASRATINNADNIPDDWGCGATSKGSMTVELFLSLCIHHVEVNLKPKGYGAGGKASILIFDGHSSRWSYAGLMYLMANNCWPFCLASHTSSWAQVGVFRG